MKKFVLFFIAFGLIVTAFGQRSPKSEKAVKNQKRLLTIDTEFQRETPATLNADLTKSTNDVGYWPVGTAKSQRSFRREETKTISYIPELDMMAISFVLDPATYDEADAAGVIGIFYSLDHGETWDGPIVTSDLTGEGLENYYLSGIAYNPDGNTDPMNAYGVYQGVATDLNTWNNKAFGSATFGNENYSTEYFTNNETGFEHDGYFNQFGLTQKADMIKAFNLIVEGEWAAFNNIEFENIVGEFNGSGFDWETEQSIVEMPFTIDLDGEAVWVGKLTFSDGAAEHAWSEDGQIGYIWMTGLTDEAETGFQPIMFKTTNGGEDWDFVEIDFQDDDAQEVLLYDEETGEGYVFSASDINDESVGYCIPWFNSSVGAVDANGNLQLFADVSGHYYEFGEWFTADTYEFSTFTGAGNLLKFTIGDDGLQDIMWIDSLRSNPSTDLVDGTTNPDLYCGTNAWLRRLQLSKNQEGTQFFVTWTDTYTGDALIDNLYPDVFGCSYSLDLDMLNERELDNDGNLSYCKTRGTLYAEHYWYVQTAEYAMMVDDETYTVPMVKAVDISDFNNNTSGSGDPVAVDYVSGIDFPVLIDGVNENISANQGVSVSQNQPNPFTGTTTIEISSNTVAPAMIEVSNIMGQTVYTMSVGTINGTEKVDLNVSDLQAGVYFYTVTVGNESISKKMIVE